MRERMAHDVAAIRIHHHELEVAPAAARERDAMAVRRPRGVVVARWVVRQASQARAVGIDGVDLVIAVAR
jgi:hypothetical protein